MRTLRNDNGNGDETGGGKIGKIIDWDELLVVPPVLARKPPEGFWDVSDDTEYSSLPIGYDADVDLLPTSRFGVVGIGGARISTDDQQITQYFGDSLVQGQAKMHPGYNRTVYIDEAYGKGRWVRLLARFAFQGASDNQDLTRFNHIHREWSRLVKLLSGVKSALHKQSKPSQCHAAFRTSTG